MMEPIIFVDAFVFVFVSVSVSVSAFCEMEIFFV